MARPRDPRTDERILEAALRCLERDGYEATTMEGIAREAEVGKPAVYLRYPSKAQVVFELTIRSATAPDLPDTGTLAGDLRAVLVRLRDSLLEAPREVFADRVAALITDEAFFADVWAREAGPVSEAVFGLWRRGVERGEVAADAPGQRIVDDLSYVVIWRTLVFHRTPDDDELAELVDRNLASALVRQSGVS